MRTWRIPAPTLPHAGDVVDGAAGEVGDPSERPLGVPGHYLMRPSILAAAVLLSDMATLYPITATSNWFFCQNAA